MKDMRSRPEGLGAKLEALTGRVRAPRAGALPELRQSLWSLRQQWDGLREDMEAVETLGGEPGDNMMAAVEQSLADLEKAYAETEARFGAGHTE